VGGSLKRLRQAETLLWQGQVDAAKALFADCTTKQAQNFINYLDKHCDRIVNYQYYQAEQICSIGSGAVESAVKQIDRRTKISGAQWNKENSSSVGSPLCLSEWIADGLAYPKGDMPQVAPECAGVKENDRSIRILSAYRRHTKR